LLRNESLSPGMKMGTSIKHMKRRVAESNRYPLAGSADYKSASSTGLSPSTGERTNSTQMRRG
jgi:hypothetical protein